MSWTQVAAYSDRFEANLVVARLRDAGIPAYMSADDLGATLPLMQLAEGGCRVLVPTDLASEARRELVRVGRHATDTHAMTPKRQVPAEEMTKRRIYAIGAILGILGGYGLVRTLLWIVWK